MLSLQLLHKGGAFINSLLYLEELGFRNSSPNIKKIAFIAWKSLIDNFALNPGKFVYYFLYLGVIATVTENVGTSDNYIVALWKVIKIKLFLCFSWYV